MRLNRAASGFAAIVIGGLLVVASAVPAFAQESARGDCPPGQPTGRPPGSPPSRPGQPDDRPPPHYPPGKCQLLISRAAAERNQTLAVQGSGYAPGENVTITLAGQQVKSLSAGADGRFSTDIVVPASAPIGATEIRAASATQVLSANFEVLASGAARAQAGSGTLPRTGLEIAGLAAAGGGLVAIGAVAVMVARRRRADSTA